LPHSFVSPSRLQGVSNYLEGAPPIGAVHSNIHEIVRRHGSGNEFLRRVLLRQLESLMKKVVVERRTRIFNDFFQIEEAYIRYERFDGQLSPVVRRLNFERGDSVAAVIFNPESHRLILVNQFKFPTYDKGPGWIIETVAGMIAENEDPDDAIRREVLEETGYRVSKLEHISTFYVSPGGSSERIILYYVEVHAKIETGGGVPSEGEDIAVVELNIEDAFAQAISGQIADAKTILGIMWLRNRLDTMSVS
jgi:nudix-type nucleoside diphosphatase (YffH/AdpP family)